MSICENNCLFIEYDSKNKKSICNCKIKSEQSSVSYLAKNTDKLSYNFEKKNQSSNAMKCYKTLFSQEGIIKNIGSYILIFTTFLFAISGILFYKCGYPLLEDDINSIIQLKEKENNPNNINIKNTELIKYKTKNKKKTNKNKIKNDLIQKVKTSKKIGKKNIKKKNNFVNKKNNINTSINNKSFSNRELKNNENIKYLQKVNNCENKKEDVKLKYCDYEKNSFSYNNAKKYDKRSFFTFYISLIRVKHYFIFSFFPIKDYNSKIIKICLFFLSFSIYYFISALFISESTIHKIYNDGEYNFIYLLPQIIYSFIISHTLYTIIKYFSLSEKNICEIKEKHSFNKVCEKADNAKKCLKIKYICFFCIGELFILFSWYYLSSFGAVYQNTQIFLAINTIISFSFSLLYPFFINIIPSIVRIYALSGSNRECAFKISRFLQFI